MAHLSEANFSLEVEHVSGETASASNSARGSNDVWLIAFGSDPNPDTRWLPAFTNELGQEAVLAILTTPVAAARLLPQLGAVASFQLWIAVKLAKPLATGGAQLPEHHAALLIFSKYRRSLRHTKTRIGYTFCPACDKTTKDYGGKKHTYHHYGTLVSDVWRDFGLNSDGDLSEIEHRLSDLFAVEPHKTLHVLDLRDTDPGHTSTAQNGDAPSAENGAAGQIESKLILGDCLGQLARIPSNSIDFCFADPPYNIDKKYDSWDDALDLQEYFRWCDGWLGELARVLRPGCTCAVLNIPQFAVRHFAHLDRQLEFQNWIVWEGLSLPVRMIMPAHYSIVCFSKGKSRELPGLQNLNRKQLEHDSLAALREFYCLRQGCVDGRRLQGENDHQPLTDLWWDIHRLKHNSRRVDHPCQLPPALMYRLISLFTYPGEVILDPFNGAGTTSLCAAQLDRRYVGIEMSETYHQLALQRHELLKRGGNPFAKAKAVPGAKNSRVKRIGGIQYAVPKKKLQLEVRTLAKRLGRLPTREDVERLSQYPIQYFDEYFISWGEVCAAARTTGMKETRETIDSQAADERQQAFAFVADSPTE